MTKYKKLIFVSTSNTSRSPMAEAIYKSLDDNSEMEVISRGLVVLFEEPANLKAEAVLNNHELTMGEHISKQLAACDMDDNTLIITMNERQKNHLSQDYIDAQNVYTIAEYTGEMMEIYDPYGGDLAEYEKFYQELVRMIKKLLYKINEN